MLPKGIKKSLPSRDWSALKREWRAAFIDYEDIGRPPESSIKDIVQENSSILIPAGKSNTIQMSSANLRTTALRESIFLTHKSGALLRSFNRDLEQQDTTYPEITAYTAAYFLSKSISMLLGLWIGSRKTNGAHWILDMAGGGSSGASAHRVNCKVGHVHVWDLFKSSINGLTSSPLDGELLSFCGGLEATYFAKLRNSLQYNSCEWTYDDLHANDSADTNWLTEFDRSIYTNADPDDSAFHFGVHLFLMLYRA
ncbi:hypothetical protein AOR11_24835, partial [Vibrio alginolyticus]